MNIVYYKLDNYYKPQFESGINLNDKDLKIKWPKKIISFQKDKNLKSFKISVKPISFYSWLSPAQ